MPKRIDIKSVLIIGAGPIVIGQACEFDYSGTQACKTLKEEGYQVILINSNPATIMTDPNTADVTYLEPITVENISQILEIEKPDAILPTMGGQTSLNVTIELERRGYLKKHNVEIIGAKINSIEMAEDRIKFKKAMDEIGIKTAKSEFAKNYTEALRAIEHTGMPAIIRPSFTLGGEGGGVAYNLEEFKIICERGFKISPISEILIEESLIGWKEFEMEVVRDNQDNCIIVCCIENIDPMGVHTGDSITIAPSITLSDKEYQIMRNSSFSVLRKIGVDTGGSNVQFAVNPLDGTQIVIEMNPRVSRSSALASKATGFPIAKVATKLAIGYLLHEINNEITNVTPASFEPSIDYIVTKIPRFAFEKFPDSKNILTTSMKSVGEAMSIGRSFKESLQKGIRSLEQNYEGLDEIEIPFITDIENNDLKYKNWLEENTPDKIFKIAQSLRMGLKPEKIVNFTKWDPWFINQIYEIICIEESIKDQKFSFMKKELTLLKSFGFSDKRLSKLSGKNTDYFINLRNQHKIFPSYRRIDTSANEFDSNTSYMYSSYEKFIYNSKFSEVDPQKKRKVIILGSGPNRIGQGIEFDYCCVHAAFALKEENIESVMINCNPETVSTDFNISSRLFFEPLTEESILDIIRTETSKGILLGVIVQLGGQTPLKISEKLDELKINILGTQQKSINIAEDRREFKKVLNKLNLKQPKNDTCFTYQEALESAKIIGFPLVLRPSYVLGGRGMKIIYNISEFKKYIKNAINISGHNPVLLDKFIENALEIDVDAISDGNEVYISGIIEHIEEAGIHSGDSACVIPPQSLKKSIIDEIIVQTKKLAEELKVIGFINIQFAIQKNTILIIEVNPRGSRTIPFVAKSTGIPLVNIATKIMLGKKLRDFNLPNYFFEYKHVSVKEAVFPFSRFPETSAILGPEMKSTGEVMGIDMNLPKAFAKSQISSKINLPKKGNIFLSVKDDDKSKIVKICEIFIKLNFKIFSTIGTFKFLKSRNIKSTLVKKIIEGRPNILDKIISKEISLVINTSKNYVSRNDSLELRKHSLNSDIPYYSSIQEALAVTLSIQEINSSNLKVKSLQSYFKK